MAKQTGPTFIEGTIGNLTFYKMNGCYYVRATTRHRRRRVLNSPRFAATMRNARWFAKAQHIASAVYRQIPLKKRNWRKKWFPLRNRAQELVRKRLPEEEIRKMLVAEFVMIRKKVPKKARVRKIISVRSKKRKVA